MTAKQVNSPILLAAFDPPWAPGGSAGAAQLGVAQPFADLAFSAVFDSSAEALIVMDHAGVIIRANRRASELLPLRDANMRSASLKDYLSGPSAVQLEPLCSQTSPATPAKLEAALANGFPIRITLRSILPGGQTLLLCLEEGSVVYRAEAKWRQVEAELRTALDSVRAGIILFDPSGRVRFTSAGFGPMFGLDARALEQIERFEDLEDLVARRFRNPEAFSAPWKSFAAGGGEPAHDELEIMRPAPRVIERFSRPVLDLEGHPVGWLELHVDVTGDRQVQSKMLQTEKMAALGHLVSGIAHELNNPLTTIIGYTQLLLGHGLRPSQLSEARKVYQEAERARHIVKNLLYFARENKPDHTRVDLNEIIERTLALRSYEMRVENIVVERDLASDLPETMADPFQLQQVVLNLLLNAEQALLEGRGQGHVWIRTRVGGNEKGRRIFLEVSDDGPGIAPEIGSRIFDPFFTTKSSGVGTGLGLWIVYGIVQQHDGEVSFDSQPGGGAKFVIELPVIAVPKKEADIIATQRAAGGATRGVPAGRILIVEDEPTVAQLIVDVLREEGHQAEAVLDSQEGLTRLSRNHYDLVICDLRMPRLDGPAFFDALVRAGSPVQHRIVFITGDTLAPRTFGFLESRGLPYLAKPFLVEELKLTVNRLLERNAKAAAAGDSSPGSNGGTPSRNTREVSH